MGSRWDCRSNSSPLDIHPPPSVTLRSALASFGRAIRAAWLIVGVTILGVLLLEGLYRGQGAVRQWLGASAPRPPHPNANEAWWTQWVATEGAVNGPSRFDPYRAWWAEPHHSHWVNVDSGGRRVTVPQGAAPIVHRVVLLGGSVMWGYTVPDSLTIPSLISATLQHRSGGHTEVLNLAQPSYNTTQGLATLLLLLRDGYRPDVVFSLDGNNDVLAALTEGHPGAAFGEGDLARRSAAGWRGVGANVVGLLRYSLLLQRLGRVGAARGGPRDDDPAAGCGDIARGYQTLVSSAEALGRRFGFRTHFLWQPHWATTRKSLTPWELAIRAEAGFPGLMRRCTVEVESLMTAAHDSGFTSLTPLFDADSSDIFLDEFGHLTPQGNARVAEAMVRLLVPEGDSLPTARP